MRIKDVLDDFEDIKIFQAYLYMDEDASITIKNVIGVPLQIRMDEGLTYRCKNLNFPDLPEMNFNDQMSIPTILGIIEQLKEQEPLLIKSMNNRWNEIKKTTLANIALNRL